MKHFQLRGQTFGTCVLIVLLFAVGCSTTSKPNPLVGWKMLMFSGEVKQINPAIIVDYNDYIKTLSSRDKAGVGPVTYFKNEMGQHAVKIDVSKYNGENWAHILVYDSNNQRIKVIKNLVGHHAS
jgi:hypothetical protein